MDKETLELLKGLAAMLVKLTEQAHVASEKAFGIVGRAGAEMTYTDYEKQGKGDEWENELTR